MSAGIFLPYGTPATNGIRHVSDPQMGRKTNPLSALERAAVSLFQPLASMDFSAQWRAVWPISSTIAAPALISGTSASELGPLIFHPSPSDPLRILLSSSSLPSAPTTPLPSTTMHDNLHAFLRGGLKDQFIPSTLHTELITSVLSDSDASSAADDPAPVNQLQLLQCRENLHFVLFFPTGENNDFIGYVGLSRDGNRVEIVGHHDGDAFVQRVGYKHARHRILRIAANSVDSDIGDVSVQGYVMATTMYSANWFKVYIKDFDSKLDKKRPFLVPTLNRGFENRVIHSCWNPYFREESAILLENGELFSINIEEKRGVKVQVLLGSDSGEWLACEFGGQPWILIVMSSKSILMVDLSLSKGMKPAVVAKIETSDLYSTVRSMQDDQYIAFCRADFDPFYFSVVTMHRLFLFDVRHPFYPILTWDHGIDCPRYVIMFRLSDLRPSEKFRCASDSGYVILLGSFWNCKFKIFCYGPRNTGLSSDSSLYSWDSPSAICLSGRGLHSANHMLREEFFKDDLSDGIQWQLKREIVLGFCILPTGHLPLQEEESDIFGGFDLLRLMSSGKLEWQKYCASWDHIGRKPTCEGESLLGSQLSHINSVDHMEVDYELDHFKLDFLLSYVKGDLSEALSTRVQKVGAHYDLKGIGCKRQLWELIKCEITSKSHTVSDAVNDISFPSSIHEISFRRILASLPPQLLYLAFSTYSELFGGDHNFSLEFFEVPCTMTHKRLPPYLVGKTSRRSRKWISKAQRGDCLVGPVLPLPVLLAVQQFGKGEDMDCFEAESNESPLMAQYRKIYKHVFPEITISGTSTFDDWGTSQESQEESPFFVYEVQSSLAGNGVHTEPLKDEGFVNDPGMPSFSLSDDFVKDENFTTFISKIHDQKNSNLHIFDDLLQVKLDYDLPDFDILPAEQEVYKRLSNQFLKWQRNFKPYQDFCNSKIPKKNKC